MIDRGLPSLALSVRQPWAELILRGRKTIECRSRPTKVRGRILLYASKGAFGTPLANVSDVLDGQLAQGVLVGTVRILDCRPLSPDDSSAACINVNFGGFAWLLVDPLRLPKTLRPSSHPQPVFFYPFGPPRS
jgi:hypothetical protein